MKNRAYGYRRTKNGWRLYDYDPLNFIVGDEGIYSTARDLAKWQTAWYTQKLVSHEGLQEALTSQKLSNGRNGRCGFSWFINNKGTKTIFHDGSWVGFNNIMLTDYNSKINVIMLSNTTEFPTEKEKLEATKKILRLLTFSPDRGNLSKPQNGCFLKIVFEFLENTISKYLKKSSPNKRRRLESLF